MGRKSTRGEEGQNRDVIRFAKKVVHGTSGTLKFPLTRDCTIENIQMRIYIGAQLDLQINPYLERRGETRQSLIKYVSGGKQYIDGDDDVISLDLAVPALMDESICVDYENADAVNDYDFYVDVTVDYLGGAYRMPVYGGLK